jgi:hypothetical protein
MSDFTDEDVQRLEIALGLQPRLTSREILAAVLPEYRRRVLREAADDLRLLGPHAATRKWLRADAEDADWSGTPAGQDLRESK